jgi:hypothetical protein
MENIKSNFAFICDQAFFSEGGKLNVIGIFKKINGKTLPLQHPQMYIVSSVFIEGSGTFEKEIKIVRVRDNFEIISPLKFTLIAKGDKGAEFGVLGQLSNLKFDEAGNYEVRIFVNSNLVNKVPFNVSII